MPTKWWIWVWGAERFCAIEKAAGKAWGGGLWPGIESRGFCRNADSIMETRARSRELKSGRVAASWGCPFGEGRTQATPQS